jgi:hypothetical protein
MSSGRARVALGLAWTSETALERVDLVLLRNVVPPSSGTAQERRRVAVMRYSVEQEWMIDLFGEGERYRQ